MAGLEQRSCTILKLSLDYHSATKGSFIQKLHIVRRRYSLHVATVDVPTIQLSLFEIYQSGNQLVTM